MRHGIRIGFLTADGGFRGLAASPRRPARVVWARSGRACRGQGGPGPGEPGPPVRALRLGPQKSRGSYRIRFASAGQSPPETVATLLTVWTRLALAGSMASRRAAAPASPWSLQHASPTEPSRVPALWWCRANRPRDLTHGQHRHIARRLGVHLPSSCYSGALVGIPVSAIASIASFSVHVMVTVIASTGAGC